MPRLRRVNRLCSSMVSGTADRPGHGSTLCSPTVEKILCRSPISERSPVSGLRRTKKQRETGVKRVETAGVYQLLLTREEGVALGANVNDDVLLGGAGLNDIAAGTADRGLLVVGMDALFHVVSPLSTDMFTYLQQS